MASVQDAIKAAQATAAQMQADEAQNESASVAVIDASMNSQGQMQTFSKPSMGTVAASTGLIPRNTMYLKPTYFGFQLGKNKDMIDEFEAEITLVEDKGFKLKHMVRYGIPAKYLSSYDGVSCDKGGSWHDALMKARLASPDADPYFAAEIKLTLTKDLKLKEETIKAGTVIGYDTSAPSRFSDWTDFWEVAAQAEAVGNTVNVKVIHRAIEHNANKWGTTNFELI